MFILVVESLCFSRTEPFLALWVPAGPAAGSAADPKIHLTFRAMMTSKAAAPFIPDQRFIQSALDQPVTSSARAPKQHTHPHTHTHRLPGHDFKIKAMCAILKTRIEAG